VLGLALPASVERALAPPISLATLTPVIALECHHLPCALHNDPIDRILVATARIEDLTLISSDRAILGYAAQGHLRALAC
jgi:PIN domain nuclease of toxin-antitoxin system